MYWRVFSVNGLGSAKVIDLLSSFYILWFKGSLLGKVLLTLATNSLALFSVGLFATLLNSAFIWLSIELDLSSDTKKLGDPVKLFSRI